MRRVLLACVAILTIALAGFTCTSFADVHDSEALEVSQIQLATVQAEGDITLQWQEIECNGYQIEYGEDSQFINSQVVNLSVEDIVTDKVIVNNPYIAASINNLPNSDDRIVTVTISNLAKDARYHVRVRAFDGEDSNISYGEWSNEILAEGHVHNFGREVIKEGSCTVAEIGRYTCDTCGYKEDKVDGALAHNFDEKVVREATCSKKGKVKNTCADCGTVEYTKTATLAHTYEQKSETDSTCSEKGEIIYACSVCGHEKSEEKELLEHTPTVSNGKIVCKDCGAEIDADTLTEEQKNLLARDQAVAWAIEIANDNSFHYGRSSWGHKSGCYFCGTQGAKIAAGASKSEAAKTYCCNPFVTAAYHHGAGASEVDCKVKSKRINLANDSNPALEGDGFERITKPSSVTELEIGDVLLTPTHCLIYAGDGKVVHAAHHDNGSKGSYWNSSIVYEDIPSRQWSRTTKIYRYVGTGKY